MRIVAGLSFLEPVCTALELDPLAAGLQILDGTELTRRRRSRAASRAISQSENRAEC